ncbi:MAG: hypothetical protein V4726_23630 [Verrucomicrobiota bacterium]
MDTSPSPPQDPADKPVDPWAEPTEIAVPVDHAAVIDRPSLWQRMGGGSLSISIVLHALLIVVALVWYIGSAVTKKEETVDFLPGGGGGGKGATEKMAAKKRQAVSLAAPKARIASTAASTVSLPDLQTSLSSLSALSQVTPMGGGMGGGEGGLKGSGSGGLNGNGNGSGFGPGRGAGFVSVPMLFGNKIDAKRLAVVLDMSGSMYPFMPVVIKEVDKVAAGSPIFLHRGCGLSDEENARLKVVETANREFDGDRISVDLLAARTSPMSQKEREDLISMVKKRAKTYFVPSTNVGTTWVALMDERLKDMDAIYWFSDFADPISDDRLKDVARKLRGRKQKLYIQPSNPDWLKPGNPMAANVAKVKQEVVDPSGGKVINVDLKKQDEDKAKANEKEKGPAVKTTDKPAAVKPGAPAPAKTDKEMK